MKSTYKSLAKRAFSWVLAAVLAAQAALAALPQTAYAAQTPAVPAASDMDKIDAVLTDYKPAVIEYTDPISGFTHPGVGVTKANLENVQAQVRGGVEPWKSYI